MSSFLLRCHPCFFDSSRHCSISTDLSSSNIYLSLFVPPPPLSRPLLASCLWVSFALSANLPDQEVDLRDLFSFDELRDSGRVNVITTEEFLEREAYTGQLGIEPGDVVKNLGVEVRFLSPRDPSLVFLCLFLAPVLCVFFAAWHTRRAVGYMLIFF